MGTVHEVDVLVVGTGAGGFVAALRAAEAGADVLVVEKGEMWGGSSATSGGGIWIVDSHLAREAGANDDPEEGFAYVRALSADNVPDSQIRAFIENGPKMLEWVEAVADTGFMPMPYPDYYPEVAGSREANRTHLIADAMSAKELDPETFATMQRASPAASLGGIINWKLDETQAALFRPKGWMTTMGKVFAKWAFDLPYRLTSTKDRRLTLGTKLLGSLRKALDARGVPVWLESPLIALNAENGRVTGARVRRKGEDIAIAARKGVILATGGFERNANLRKANLGGAPSEPEASGGQRNNTGDALQLGQAVGAATRNLDSAWWAPVFRIPGEERARLSTVERALPYSLIVDQSGKRYANEALAYHRFGEVMLAGVRDSQVPVREPSWLVFDARYRARYPVGPVLPGMPDAMLPGAVKSILRKSGTIRDLGAQMGVPADDFVATIERFNTMAAAGRDEDFGRGDAVYDRMYGDPRVGPNPSLGALEKAPFYAMPLHLGDIGTNGGLLTDDKGAVLDANARPIAGLYAVGNVSASVMGYSYPGAGATLGPAMTFGYLAAGDALGLNA